MVSRRSLLLGSSALFMAEPATYHLGILRSEVSLVPPPGKRIPFGWKAFELTKPVIIGFKALIRENKPSRFRLALAIDTREVSRVEIFLPQGRWDPAVMDLRYPGQFQIFEVELDPEATKVALKGGIGIRRTEGTAPLFFFAPEPSGASTPSELQPHLMIAGSAAPLDEFQQRLHSWAALQPWGWKLGCVLDGILQMEKPLGKRGVKQAFERLLKLHFPDGKNLTYEGVRSEPIENRLYGVEAPLPFGPLARYFGTKCPGLEILGSFVQNHTDPNGVISDGGGVIKTEECYTVAYPLAVLGSLLKEKERSQQAILQLRARRDLLASGDAIYQKGKPGDLVFRNWSRGIAWYLLGLVRSLEFLPPTPDLDQAFQKGAQLALRLQNAQGLWDCFAGEPKTAIDTSGSAGIAAALALGARRKLLGAEALAAARKAATALEPWLTPDGFLGGVAQENRGGEELQRSGYRVHAQFAMGLYAQLLGALEPR